MTKQEALVKAADLLERSGWCRGVYHTVRAENGALTDCYCAVGAIRKVTGHMACPDDSDAERLAHDATDLAFYYVLQKVDWRNLSLVQFNDNVATSKEQIIDVFRKAAAYVETDAD